MRFVITQISFPVNPERRQRWISLLDLENQHIIKYAQICSNHFDQSDIMVTELSGRRQIRPDAEPQLNTTVFTGASSFSSDSTISNFPKKLLRSLDVDFESPFENSECSVLPSDLTEVTAEQNNVGSSNLILPETKHFEQKSSSSTETTETASETEMVIHRAGSPQPSSAFSEAIDSKRQDHQRIRKRCTS
ncbi:unnamed protein product [Phaedon cochleariae]|uniref:THAP-type domain-containing protein n=1 Tax=Phaedon cochleariae TaxID=80249 RepID=A0A9N9SL79_PHACE|nr:unnamed protein product [Phaedon cochleariae]